MGVCGKLCVGHRGGTCKGQLPERSVEASSTEDTSTSVGLSQGLAAVGWSDLQVEGQAGRGAEDSQDKVAPGSGTVPPRVTASCLHRLPVPLLATPAWIHGEKRILGNSP